MRDAAPPTPVALRDYEAIAGPSSLRHSTEEQAAFYAGLVEHLPYFVVHWLPDGTLIFGNRAFREGLQAQSPELTGTQLFSRIPQEDHRRVWQMVAELAPDQPERALEHRVLLPDGARRWVRCTSRGIFDETGRLVEIQSSGELSGRDDPAPPRVKGDLRSLVDAQRAVTQVVISARSEKELLQRACEILIEKTGYTLAWVGYPQPDAERSVSLEAQAGVDAGYLDRIRISWGEDPSGQGPGGQALQTGQPVVCRDLQEEPRAYPWQALARQCGLRSVIGLPLLEGSRPFGILGLYDTEADVFGEEEKELLTEVAQDLAHGVLALRARQERDRLAAILDATPDFVGIADADGKVLYHNPAAARLLGKDAGSGSSRWPVERSHPAWAARKVLDEAFPTAAREGVWQGEVPFLDHQGREIPFSQTILAHRDSGGLVTHYSTIARDISDLKAAQARLREQLFTAVEIFGNLVELRSEALAEHSWRVLGHAVSMGRMMGLPETETNDLFLAGLLHDIGTLSFPEDLFKKPWSRMTAEERDRFKRHPVLGEEVLAALEPLDAAARIIRHHHEYLDGSGFPDGLTGEAIPLGARILVVANDFDDLIHGRIYARPYTPEEALERLQECSGHLYDPGAIEALRLLVGAEQGLSAEGTPSPPADAGEESPAAPEPAAEGSGVDGEKAFPEPRAPWGEDPPLVREAAVEDLKPGMVLAGDLISPEGMVLLLRGRTLDERIIGKLRDLEEYAGRQYRILIHQPD